MAKTHRSRSNIAGKQNPRYSHGLRYSPEYQIWAALVQRCHNPKAKDYPSYGGRGITVCDEWHYDFAAFFAHVGKRPSAKHSIDRIDNNRGYEPGNVRWATRKEQCRNRRDNHLLTFNGQTMTVIEWSEKTGLGYITIITRLKNGWTAEQSLTTPINFRHRMLTHNDTTACVSEWERIRKFPDGLIKRRLRRGWSVPDAIETPPQRSVAK